MLAVHSRETFCHYVDYIRVQCARILFIFISHCASAVFSTLKPRTSARIVAAVTTGVKNALCKYARIKLFNVPRYDTSVNNKNLIVSSTRFELLF